MKFIYQFLFIVVAKVYGQWLGRMNYATRLRLVTQNHPHEYPIAIIIRSLNNILLFVEIPVPNLFCWQYQKKNLWGNLKNRLIVLK
jgi:hypothetical protein